MELKNSRHEPHLAMEDNQQFRYLNNSVCSQGHPINKEGLICLVILAHKQ